MKFPFPEPLNILEEAIRTKQGSALAAYVATGTGEQYSVHLGCTAHADSGGHSEPLAPHHLFDLASMTKILVTMPLCIEAQKQGLFDWTDSISRHFPEFPHEEVQILHLLQHSSGLPAHEKFFERPEAEAQGHMTQKQTFLWICESKLKQPPGEKVVYSDLGILLVGFLLEKVMGKSLAALFQEHIAQPLKLQHSGFRLLSHYEHFDASLVVQGAPDQFVATANCPHHKRLLQGEVDDNNCWALGGCSAHAGLFSNLEETVLLAQNTMKKAALIPQLFYPAHMNSQPPFTTGYMLYPGLRPVDTDEWQGAIGHTGFVGTSLWHEPKSGRTTIVLGNRVHPDRDDNRWISSRLKYQNSLW